MAIRHNTLNSYFKIVDGKAVSLGRIRPTGIKRDTKLRGRFAKVIVSTISNKATIFKAPSSSSAFDKIRRSIKRARINTRVRLGKPIGKKDGKIVYRSVAGYTKVRD